MRGKRKGARIASSNVLCASVLALATMLGAAAAHAQSPQFEQLRIVAPAAPGGGWDQTARAMQQVLERTGIVTTPIVENIPGAAGTIGLARFIGAERGNGDALLVSGLIMLGGIVTNDSPVTLADAVPIARLTGEYEALAVPARVAVCARSTTCSPRSASAPNRSRGAAAPSAAATRSSRG